MEPIFQQDKFITKAACKKLISYHKNNCPKDETSHGVYNNRTVNSYDDSIRNLTSSIHHQILSLVQKFYNEDVLYLAFSNLVYWGKGMELVPHADNFWIEDPKKPHYSSHRVYSSILYLNNNFKGGETYFPEHNYSIEPKSGKLTFYTSGAKHIHGVKKVTSGTRYTLATWYTKDLNRSILSKH